MKEIATSIAALVLLLALSGPSGAADRRPNGDGHLVTMTFEFVDACDDGYSPEIEFYLKDDPSRFWGTYWLSYFNVPLQREISCASGQEVCFGAWLEDASWGCGKKCVEPVKGACFVCQEALVSIGLECKK